MGPNQCFPSYWDTFKVTSMHMNSTLAQFVEIVIKLHSVPREGPPLVCLHFFQWKVLCQFPTTPCFFETSPHGWIVLVSDTTWIALSSSYCIAEKTRALESKDLDLRSRSLSPSHLNVGNQIGYVLFNLHNYNCRMKWDKCMWDIFLKFQIYMTYVILCLC